MANNPQNVAVGKPKATGGAFSAPTGTALPTTVVASLNAAFHNVGYVSSDGLTMNTGESTQKIQAWGATNVRTVQTEQDVTIDLTMLETNAESAGVYYGFANVTSVAANDTHGTQLTIEVVAANPGRREWVFELKDGDRTGRVVVPDAEVTSRGAVQFIDNDAVKYPITLTCYEDGTAVKAYIYWDDGILDEA